MSNEEIMSIFKSHSEKLDHSLSREEIKALLDSIATVFGFEGEGWLKMVSSSTTSADFKLDRLPPDEMMSNFVSMVCLKFKLSEYVHLAALAGKYSIQPGDGSHILHIGDSATK